MPGLVAGCDGRLSLSSIIIGLVFIVGGLSGRLALIGTNSGVALAVVGLLLIGRGIWRIRKQRAARTPVAM